jgi:hypothetical protein
MCACGCLCASRFGFLCGGLFVWVCGHSCVSLFLCFFCSSGRWLIAFGSFGFSPNMFSFSRRSRSVSVILAYLIKFKRMRCPPTARPALLAESTRSNPSMRRPLCRGEPPFSLRAAPNRRPPARPNCEHCSSMPFGRDAALTSAATTLQRRGEGHSAGSGAHGHSRVLTSTHGYSRVPTGTHGYAACAASTTRSSCSCRSGPSHRPATCPHGRMAVWAVPHLGVLTGTHRYPTWGY